MPTDLPSHASAVGPYGYNIIITPELNQIMTFVLPGTVEPRKRAVPYRLAIIFVQILLNLPRSIYLKRKDSRDEKTLLPPVARNDNVR